MSTIEASVPFFSQLSCVQYSSAICCVMQRFIPSEFGSDPDKVRISRLDAGNNFYKHKSEIRRLVEAEGLPYTCISCNLFTSVLLPSLIQPGLKAPPRDKVTIFGDGNTKGLFVQHHCYAPMQH